jgi:hypothetical protein
VWRKGGYVCRVGGGGWGGGAQTYAALMCTHFTFPTTKCRKTMPMLMSITIIIIY